MHATIRPVRHRLIKKWVYGVTIAGVWVLAAMLSTALLILRQYRKERPHHLYLWQSYCCLCLLVICVSYSSIVVKFLCGAHPQHHGADNRQRKLTVTLFIMTIVSLLMWLPFCGRDIVSFSGQVGWNFLLIVNLIVWYSLKILYLITRLLIPSFTQSECQSSEKLSWKSF